MTRSNGVVTESRQGRLHWHELEVPRDIEQDDEITDQ
jgi:hypothetical protein